MNTATLPAPAASKTSSIGSSGPWQLYFSRLTSVTPARWNLTTAGGLLTLIAMWSVLLRWTWARWGSLTIDCGHEMYVPALLSEGKMLYRDVWFMYGPLAPYLNGSLFRVFGVHLNVLYWSGSLAALGSAIFLSLSGMRLSS
jgi:hypothetical protein